MGIFKRTKARVTRARKTVRRKVSRVRKAVKRRVTRKPTKRATKKTTTRRSTSRARTAIRKTSKLSKRIRAFKKPATQVPKTEKKSSWFEKARAGARGFVSRSGKVAENKPAIFDLKGWQAKNRSWLAGKTSGLKEWQAGNRANLKEKVDFVKTGIGAITGNLRTSAGAAYEATKNKTAGIVNWFKDKTEDVTEAVTGAVENVTGAAEDWKAKRERKSLIRKIVLGLVLLFLGLLLWKKAK